ncbi:MAG: glycogen synthase [Acidobacteria bacterium]|nr:MAG: glycogen synthase [Acidobacteriota bacterium]
MDIVHITPEFAPFAKAGGLGDVAAALPAAQAERGHRVRVLVPGYRELLDRIDSLPGAGTLPVSFPIGGREIPGVAVRKSVGPVELWAIAQRELFDRPGLYGGPRGAYPDNGVRYLWFSGAALAALRCAGDRVAAVFCHDWPAAAAAVLLRVRPVPDDPLEEAASVLVIHNLAHQGIFPSAVAAQLPLPRLALGHGATINILAAGIRYATELVTVSPTYAREILTPEAGCGLDDLLRARRRDLHGVLNGLDTSEWDPARDPALPANYGPDDPAGKEACKVALQRELGLVSAPGAPLFGVVSRADPQKGLDLVREVLPWIAAEGAQAAVLCAGDPHLTSSLAAAARAAPRAIAVVDRFDEAIARRIYGAADFFLMPSRFEPCGLGQLIAMRYGALPVARRTGGLADTVVDVDEDPEHGTGLLFDRPEAGALQEACRRALVLVRAEPERFSRARRRAMLRDFSWSRSAARYDRILGRAVRRERSRVLR